MSHQPGRMGIAEGLAIVFIASQVPIFLAAGSELITKATTASWMVPLINGVVGFIVTYLLLFVLQSTDGDLYMAAENLLGKLAVRLIAIYYAGVYLFEAAILLDQFVDDIMVTALPKVDNFLIVGWFTLMVAAVLLTGIEPIARAGYAYLPVATLGMLTILALLMPKYEPLYLTPWNGPGLATVLATSLTTTGANIVIIVPFFLARSFQNARTIKCSILYGLGLSAAIKSLVIGVYLAVVGPGSGQDYIMPFYELARLVSISRFVQRIEAIFILLWIVMGILAIAIYIYAMLYIFGRLFNLPAIRPLVGSIMVVVAALPILTRDHVSSIILYRSAQTTVYNVGVLVIPLVLFLAAVVRNRRRNTCSNDL